MQVFYLILLTIFIGCNGEQSSELLAEQSGQSDRSSINDTLIMNEVEYLKAQDRYTPINLNVADEWQATNTWNNYADDKKSYIGFDINNIMRGWFRINDEGQMTIVNLRGANFYVPFKVGTYGGELNMHNDIERVICDLTITIEGDVDSGVVFFDRDFLLYWEGTRQRQECEHLSKQEFDYVNDRGVLILTNRDSGEKIDFLPIYLGDY